MDTDTYYCFPLPAHTDELLTRFWRIDASGACLCEEDLRDGLCPFDLADELAETIARLESELSE